MLQLILGISSRLIVPNHRSLEKDKEETPERVQAFKAVYRMIDIGPASVPQAIATALVAIAECQEDPFCSIAMEILCCFGKALNILPLAKCLPPLDSCGKSTGGGLQQWDSPSL